MRALIASLAILMSLPAAARPHCTDMPAESWIPAAEMKARIASAEYKVDVFKTTAGNCYEIYGRNKDGMRVEVYFDPVTGKIVKESARR